MPRSRKPKVVSTGSPVLDAWALAGELERQGTDWRAELDKANGIVASYDVDPTAPISADGLPLIPRDWIAGLQPDQVADRFYDAVLTAAGREGAEWGVMRLRFHELPQPWRLIYTVCWLQAEVDNGGFDQFFYNGQGEFDDDTERDLELLGAEKFHDLFVAARRVYYAAPPDREDRIPELESLTDEFYAQPQTPCCLVGEYILQKQDIYCCD